MGKKFITVDGKMYFVDDETGIIYEVALQQKTLPPEVTQKIVSILAKKYNPDED